jgi:hypothetical protein
VCVCGGERGIRERERESDPYDVGEFLDCCYLGCLRVCVECEGRRILETLTTMYQSTRWYVSDNNNVRSYRPQKLKSYTVRLGLFVLIA